MATLKKYGNVKIAPYANLCGADLCRADLRMANLCGANLCRADLRGANLYGANLRMADLRMADLCGANLYGANLCMANLGGANLCGANLCRADLRGANLYGADLGEGNWIICGPSRSDGYAFFYMKLKDDKIARVVAGCRHFTMQDAREHWGKGYEKAETLGAETKAILDCLAAMAKARGLDTGA